MTIETFLLSEPFLFLSFPFAQPSLVSTYMRDTLILPSFILPHFADFICFLESQLVAITLVVDIDYSEVQDIVILF